ncbi:MAG: hypothetical protein GVY19_08330 [Bacteroidetes bacterium]|jgi:hypothetical protein|nr:hypothetical protein [Bacteroidota bacterium]
MHFKHLRFSACVLIIFITINILSSTHAQPHSIAFFSSHNNITPEGYLYDKPLMDTLRGLGYKVDHKYTTNKNMSVEMLNKYNLIIIGRGSRSGDFTDTGFWEKIKTPVLCLSGYMLFPNHLNLICKGKLQGPNGDLLNKDVSTVQYINIVAPNDPIFHNISNQDMKIPYNTWIYDYIDYDSATFIAKNQGKLLATYTAPDESPVNKKVAMARWLPGVRVYKNGVTPKGYRTYMQMGTDNDGEPVILNHMQFTPESFLIFTNEIKYLISLYLNAGCSIKKTSSKIKTSK